VSDEHYCPRCKAEFLCFNGVNTRHFKCGSSTQIPSVACGYASQLQERIKRLEEALAWYETKVSDCNRQGPEGDAARDALAKDYGRKAKEAKP